MDKFKKQTSTETRKMDLYDTMICYNSKVKANDKKMLKQMSRTRLKHQLEKEINNIEL